LIKLTEEVADISIEHEVHLPAHDPDRQRIQRIMLRAPRPKPVRETQEIRRAPRGAMRKEMTEDNISSVPAGMPAPGRCSCPEKLGTAKARDRASEVKRPDNVTAGRHCQTPACVLARPKGRAKAKWW
jgi:hypothetical protein